VRLCRRVLRAGLRELLVRPAQQEAALDGLRSLAVLAVLGAHWAGHDFSAAGGRATGAQQWPVFVAGWAGVDLFFALSGLLIGRQLWRELEATGSVQIGRFLLKRGLRIWPLYFTFLALTALLTDRRPGWVDFAFLTNYLPNAMGRSWSLSTEEQFYLAVPLLLLLVRRRIPRLGYLAIFAALEVAVLTVRHATLVRVLLPGETINDHYYTLFAPFHTHLEGLLAGLVVSLLATSSLRLFSEERLRGFSRVGFAVLLGAAVVAAGLRRLDHHLFTFLELGLLFGALTFWALLDHSWVSAPLRWRCWYPISRLAYGVYLNHFWMTPRLNQQIVALLRGVTASEDAVFLCSLACTTLVSLALAVVSFVVIEQPFLMLRARWLEHRRAAQQPWALHHRPASMSLQQSNKGVLP